MRLLRGICLVTSLSLLGLTASPSAHAQAAGTSVPGKEYAKRLFEEGVDLEKKADYAGALAKYKEAEQITVTPGLRFHTGYCLEMTGKLVAALETYEVADKLARDQNKQDVRAAITARLEPLRARVPQLALRLVTTGVSAEVQLDGATVGAPLLDGKPFRMEAGEHVITARAAGYKPFSRKVQVPENATTQVEVSLERASGAVAPVAGAPPAAAQPASSPPPDGQPTTAIGEPPADASPHRSRALPIATTAGAVVLAGTGIALFLAAGSAHSTAESDCLAKPTCDTQQSKIRTFDALALGGFVGAAGLAVVSVILWTSKAPDRAAAPPRAWIVATPSTVGVTGAF